MNENGKTILKFLLAGNGDLVDLTILIKSLNISDKDLSTIIGHLEWQTHDYAAFKWERKGQGAGVSNGLKIEGNIRPGGRLYLEELERHEKSILLQSNSNEIANNALQISKDNIRKTNIVSVSACIFSALAMIASIWLPYLEYQTKWIITVASVLLLVIIVLSQLSGNKLTNNK